MQGTTSAGTYIILYIHPERQICHSYITWYCCDAILSFRKDCESDLVVRFPTIQHIASGHPWAMQAEWDQALMQAWRKQKMVQRSFKLKTWMCQWNVQAQMSHMMKKSHTLSVKPLYQIYHILYPSITRSACLSHGNCRSLVWRKTDFQIWVKVHIPSMED